MERKVQLFCVFYLVILFLFFLLAGCSSDDSNNVNNGSSKLNAEAGAIQTTASGEVINLNASASTGKDLTYNWSFRSTPGQSQAKITSSSSVNASYFADKPGTFVVQLVVKDGSGAISRDYTVINITGATIKPLDDDPDFDHTGLTADCAECHAGADATADTKPANHINTTDNCSVCHSTLFWDPNINVDHNEVLGACSDCHNGIIAIGKPATHIETIEECNACHNPGTTFTINIVSAPPSPPPPGPAFDHSTIVDACIVCHDGATAIGKGPNHIPSTDECEDCHTTVIWVFPVVDHTAVTGVCSSCHDGVIASGQGPNHIVTTDECDVCHGTVTWFIPGPLPSPAPPPTGPGPFDHSTIVDTCVTCHDGVTATGKSATHLLSSDLCEACHITLIWVPVFLIDHVEVIGICSSCHDGVIATGKTPNHVVTTEECDVCHNASTWTIVNAPIVAPPPGPPTVVDHTTLVSACVTCHDGAIASGKSAVHIPSSDICEACHLSYPSTWVPVLATAVNHTQIVGACFTCHNNTIALGKPPTHITTTDVCEACHQPGPIPFTPVAISAVDHAEVLGTCSSCHNGVIASGKIEPPHVITVLECDVCHTDVTNWLITVAPPP